MAAPLRLCVLLLLCASCVLVMSAKSPKSKRSRDRPPRKNMRDEQPEKSLAQSILHRYNSYPGRPVTNATQTLNVSIGMSLNEILSVTRINHAQVDIALMTMMTYEWTDRTLAWDYEAAGLPDNARLPITSLWRPDIKLYNSLDVKTQEDESLNAVVRASGQVTYITPTIHRVRCGAPSTTNDSLDFDWECKLKFGSWTYSGDSIDLQLAYKEGMDLSSYNVNAGYTIVDTTANRVVTHYACCPEAYVSVNFIMKIKQEVAVWAP